MNASLRIRMGVVVLAWALGAGSMAKPAAASDSAPPEVLDLAEAAALLRVPSRQVQQMAQAHQLPGRLVGGHWRFARSGLLAWLSGQDPDAIALATTAGAAGGGSGAIAGAPAVAPPAAAAPAAGERASPAASASAGGGSVWPQMAIGEIDLASITEAAEPGEPGRTAKAGEGPATPARAAGSAPAAPAPAAAAAATAATAAAAAAAPPSKGNGEPSRLGERPTSSTAQEVALRDQGALLRRGTGSVEFGAYHAHSEQTLVPVVRQEQNTFGVNATARYGLADDVQVVAGVPGVRNRTITYTDASVTGTAPQQGSVESHWGDASLSLLAVAMHESTGRPNLIVSLDTVLPTGPGDRGVGAGLVVSKSYDPAVIFAGVSYMQGLSVDASDSSRSLARHNFGLNLGYTYALNDALALNTVFSEIYRDTGAPDSTSIPPPSERSQLQLGMTWMMGHGIFVEPSIALRLGGASPDVTESANVVVSY